MKQLICSLRTSLIGFFEGKSKPRCHELAEIFLQLRISERSGRGVTKVVNTYGKEAFKIEEDFIKVIIPFVKERIFETIKETNVKNKVNNILKPSQIKDKMISEMKNNPNIKISELMTIINLGKTSINQYIKELIEEGYVERVGAKKNGYWKVN